MQFVLICRDAPDMLQRRLALRETHLENIHKMYGAGEIIDGGAILSDDGDMIGSIVLCDFPDRDALDTYLSQEVYATEGIWGDIEILPMRRVQWQS